VYGQTDLGDYYRGDLTLRQLLVRIQALPVDSPLQELLTTQAEEFRQQQNSAEVDRALSIFKVGG
jgi:hypothetical protein